MHSVSFNSERVKDIGASGLFTLFNIIIQDRLMIPMNIYSAVMANEMKQMNERSYKREKKNVAERKRKKQSGGSFSLSD